MLIRIMAALALLASPAFADDAETGSDIVVVGERLREQVRSFISESAEDMVSEDQMARWERRMCPMLVGVQQRDHAQFLIDRIAQRAYAVGVDSEEPGCRPNVLIFVTPESERLAREIAAQHRAFVGYHANTTAVTMGRDALSDFVETPRPVRWWYVSQTTTEDGDILGDTQATPSADGVRNAQTVRLTSPSRLRRTTRQDLSRIIVIVDADEAAGVQLATLGDYLAMVSLAQITADAELSAAPSILDLFAAREPGRQTPSEMTAWDVAYLEGLYAARRTAPDAQTQRRDIARRMERELAN